MRHAVVGSFAGVLAGVVLAAPAGAASGGESFNGVIVASGASGTRTVVSSVVVAKGVFTGVGRIVEIPDLPTDPANFSRDDLVFARGTMHLVSATVDASFSIDPRSCVFDATLQQTSEIQGGTGMFAHASGTGTATVRAHGIAAHDPDGSCSEDRDALLDVDVVSSVGTLSF
jgi:hypothetical protein